MKNTLQFARCFLVGLSLSVTAGTAIATTSTGFQWGDVCILYGSNPRIDRIIPKTSASGCDIITLLPNSLYLSFYPLANDLIYDSSRDRLLLVAKIGGIDDVWQLDSAGNVSSLGYSAPSLPQQIAPTGDGRVFFWDSPYLRLLKTNGQTVTVLEAQGPNHFALCGGSGSGAVNDMVYDPETNSLFTLSGTQCLCGSGADEVSCIRKLPLDPSGERVIGPVSSVAVPSSLPNASGKPVLKGDAKSLSIGPKNTLVAALAFSGIGKEIMKVDPVTMQKTTYNTFPMSYNYFHGGGDYVGTVDGVVIHHFYNSSIPFVDHRLAIIYEGVATEAGVTLCELGTISTAPGSLSAVDALDITSIRTPWNACSLTLDVSTVSVSQSTPQQQNLLARIGNPALVGKPYLLLGSISGFAPGLTINQVHLPVILDAYSELTVLLPGGIASGNPGVLDASSQAQVTIQIPPGVLPPASVGLTLYHTLRVHDAGVVKATTNPAPLTIEP